MKGIKNVPGVGIEWYVRVDRATWKKLDFYARKIDMVSFGGATAKLLES